MDKICLDIQKDFEWQSHTYKMYGQTNEDIDSLFKNFNFNNKNVLSVLASSDQLLSCYYYGAKNVDTFDRNIRALYYYYLRKWLFIYKNQLYPYFCGHCQEYIDIIKKIKPKNIFENEAKSFWINILSKDFKEMTYFEYSPYTQRMKYANDYLFIKYSFNRCFTFTSFDMFNSVYLKKKYDIIVLSNMLEYIRGNKEQLFAVKKNLENMLNPEGQVICSYIMSDHEDRNFLLEKDILTMDDLTYEGHYIYYEPLLGKNSEAGYSYRLEKKTKAS